MAAVRSNPQVVLKPQDLLVLLRLSLLGKDTPTLSYAALSAELGLTASEIHAGLDRALQAQLVHKDIAGKPQVIRDALRLFVQHGARYAFPATRGGQTRGWPTGYAAAPLKDMVVQSAEPPPVWPDKDGPVRGLAFYPLYPSTPRAVAQNPALYELLALFDALRGGSMRERALAQSLLEQRLG